MKKFDAIEGLRGWLAWTVVLCHLADFSDLHAKGFGSVLKDAGLPAVLAFIIISGFVITHLVTERPEPYRIYLLRRFMRIFPLFAVACIVGFFTTDILVSAMSRVAWAAEPNYADSITVVARGSRSTHEFLLLHVLAHLTMLHGVISDTLLPFSLSAFDGPAWSLSLEWQFYLVAPFVILLAGQRRTIVRLALAIAVVEIAYQIGLLGRFELPSPLPAAAGYFAVGIASRLAYPTLAGTVRHPGIIFALFVILVPIVGAGSVALLVWALLMSGLAVDRSHADTVLFAQIYRYALESRAAKYFGSRSYSVYLCHLPIIAISLSLWLDIFPTAQRALTFFGLSAIAVPLTLVASELAYRCIERPGIALGSRLVRRMAAAAAARAAPVVASVQHADTQTVA